MENYQMNRPCGRPYNATCGMAKEMMSGQQCSCRNNSRNQPSRPSPYDLGYALKVGTVFPQLCKPFCGKRGGQR